jgi:hypothetical protein
LGTGKSIGTGPGGLERCEVGHGRAGEFGGTGVVERGKCEDNSRDRAPKSGGVEILGCG